MSSSSLQLLFIADPLSSFRIYKDSTYAMMYEAAERGHVVHACQPQHLALDQGRIIAQVLRVQMLQVDYAAEPHGARDDWYDEVAVEARDLSTFDAILLRKDPPFDMEYVTTTWLLERAQQQGAQVFNAPRAIRDHNEKLAISEFLDLTAPTLVTRDPARLRAFHAEHRDIVLKPLDGMGGLGVFRIRADGMNLGSIIETLGQQGDRTLMAQRYLPDIIHGDKRILLIGGKVVPYCLARVPQPGDIRANLAAGGLGVARELSVRDRDMAERLAPVLQARGLLLVGLDVIGDYLTEINVTSPTGFREIMTQTGCNVAGQMLDALEMAVSSQQGMT
jgi:glutathione synthase